MKSFKNYITAIFLFVINVSLLMGQTSPDTSATYKMTDQSTMKITGTSTVHDWEANVEGFDVQLKLNPQAKKVETPQPEHYKSVTVEVPVKSIESGKGGMNNKIYGALKEKKHPKIRFNLNEVSRVDSPTEDTTFTLTLSGELTIAGVTRSVKLSDVNGQQHPDGTYQFKGSKSMKMTEFEVDPPSAMFGAIKAGDEITVAFDVTMKPSNKQ